MQAKQFFFIAGLPRSGSTLLSNILAQNPNIRAEGNSGLCTIMWDTSISCDVNALEQLRATRRFPTTKLNIMSALPYIYYHDAQETVIFDKCRKWCSDENMGTILSHITPDPRVIVLVRPLEEVVKSFVHLYEKSGKTLDVVPDLLVRRNNPLIHESVLSVRDALRGNPDHFLFVKYDDLVNSTKSIIEKIYDFCGLERFEHNFDCVTDFGLEDDSVYGLLGMHDVRSSIGKSSYSADLPEDAIRICKEFDEVIKLALE